SIPRPQVREALEIPAACFVSRGYSSAVLDALDVGHSAKQGRTVLPLYDDTGEVCIGYLSRSEKPLCQTCDRCHPSDESCGRGELRWSMPKDFPRGSYLYNLAAARVSDGPFVLVVEGPGDVFRAAEAGFPAVALLGSGLTEIQAEKL